MRLAGGMCGPGERFAVIDTENGRALHYADQFDFDHARMDEPFGTQPSKNDDEDVSLTRHGGRSET